MFPAYPGPLPDFGPGQFGDRLRQHDAARKVVGVDSAMYGVYFDSRRDIETRLLESQT
jgi:hypothetical protein